MAEARGRENWAHTSAILALIANVHRDPKKTRAFRPSDFDPYERQHCGRGEVIEVTCDNIETLKQAFTTGRKGC